MLCLNAIDPTALALLKRIQTLPVLANTRLVGGTALALQLGHRVSVDLDFFGEWDYSTDLRTVFRGLGRAQKQSGTPDGRLQFFFVDGVKVDCVAYGEHPWLEPAVEEGGIRLAGVKDIGAMKINAITNRGSRKDFVDLARLLEDWPLEEIFRWYAAKYRDANPVLALRSLSYFADAEAEPMPRMLVGFDWTAAKRKISQAVRQLVLKSVGERRNEKNEGGKTGRGAKHGKRRGEKNGTE